MKKRERSGAHCGRPRSPFLSLVRSLNLARRKGRLQYVGTISEGFYRRRGRLVRRVLFPCLGPRRRARQRLSRSRTRSSA